MYRAEGIFMTIQKPFLERNDYRFVRKATLEEDLAGVDYWFTTGCNDYPVAVQAKARANGHDDIPVEWRMNGTNEVETTKATLLVITTRDYNMIVPMYVLRSMMKEKEYPVSSCNGSQKVSFIPWREVAPRAQAIEVHDQ